MLQLPAEHYAKEQADAPTAIRPYDAKRIGNGRGQEQVCIVMERADYAKSRGKADRTGLFGR